MNRLAMYALAALSCLLCTLAWAQDAPPPDAPPAPAAIAEDAGGEVVLTPPKVAQNELAEIKDAPARVKSVKESAQEGDWRLAMAGILSLLILVVRKLWDKIPSEYLPWAVLAVALLGSVMDGLYAGESVGQILMGAVEVSCETIGVWHLALKPLLGRVLDKSKEKAA